MKYRVVLAIVILLTLIVPGPVSSAPQATREPDDAGLAVALVIDSSGSMKTNDPEGERIAAARRVVTLLREEDEIAVIQFANSPSILVPLRKVGVGTSREEVLDSLSGIGAQGGTDIKGGLETALSELSKGDKGNKCFVILLSDGKPDLPYLTSDEQKMMEYLEGVRRCAKAFKDRGWPVHSIVLKETETAGPLLREISETTGGESFSVDEADALVQFFQSVLLVEKHASVRMPETSFKYEARTYKAGERFPVYASFSLGEDTLIPGPHLRVNRLYVTISIDGRHLEEVELLDNGHSPDKEAEDGVFSAWVNPQDVGRLNLTLFTEGEYRGREIREEITSGEIEIEAAMSQKYLESVRHLYLDFIRNPKALMPSLGAIIAVLILLTLTAIWRKRDFQSIKGTLRYWDEENIGTPTIHEMNLSRLKKTELLVSTENSDEASFTLPPKTRDFAFRIKKFVSAKKEHEYTQELVFVAQRAYMVISNPGTFVICEKTPGSFEDLPRSRKQIFHGDRFKVRGYVFEFNCPEAGHISRKGGTPSKMLSRISRKNKAHVR